MAGQSVLQFLSDLFLKVIPSPIVWAVLLLAVFAGYMGLKRFPSSPQQMELHQKRILPPRNWCQPSLGNNQPKIFHSHPPISRPSFGEDLFPSLPAKQGTHALLRTIIQHCVGNEHVVFTPPTYSHGIVGKRGNGCVCPKCKRTHWKRLGPRASHNLLWREHTIPFHLPQPGCEQHARENYFITARFGLHLGQNI